MDPAAVARATAAGVAAVDAGACKLAIEHFTCAFKLYRRTCASIEKADISEKLAYCYSVSSPPDYDAQLRYADEALAVVNLLDPADPRVRICRARSEYRRGAALTMGGRTTEAIAALEVARSLLADAAIDIALRADTLIKLASNYRVTGEAAKGLLRLDEAEALLFGHRWFADDLIEARSAITINRGALLSTLGRFDESLACYKNSLSQLVDSYGADDPRVAKAMAEVGAEHLQLGQHTVAIRTLRAAVAMMERHGCSHYSEFAAAQNNIGVALCAGGEYRQALGVFQRALANYQRHSATSHSAIANLQSNIADIQARLGDVAGAARSRYDALAAARRLQTRCAGPECPRKLREDGAPLDVCVKCRATFYCGKACQTADWKREGGHKAECKALIAKGKAAAAAAVERTTSGHE